MAFTEELIERIGGAAGPGIGAGIVAVVLAPRVARPLGRGVRWLAKGAIKGSLLVAYRTRDALAATEAGWARFYAEAQAELNAAEKSAAKANGTPKQRREPASEPAPAPRKVEKVNLNEADRGALMALPGVGERIAEKILEHRAAHGRIGSVEELRDADILSNHTAEMLRYLVVT